MAKPNEIKFKVMYQLGIGLQVGVFTLEELIEGGLEVLEVCRDTGITFKDGSPIFEGDSLGTCEKGHNWTVEWSSFGDPCFYGVSGSNSCRELRTLERNLHGGYIDITDKERLEF